MQQPQIEQRLHRGRRQSVPGQTAVDDQSLIEAGLRSRGKRYCRIVMYRSHPGGSLATPTTVVLTDSTRRMS